MRKLLATLAAVIVVATGVVVAKDVTPVPVDLTASYVWADRPANVECGNGWAYVVVTAHGVRNESQGGCTPVAAPLANDFNGVLPGMLANVSH